MKEPLVWHSDEHGTYNLHCPLPHGGQAHVWIQARRPYCDRGHWEWGSMGLFAQPGDAAPPSHYFMHLETALAEIEAWLGRQRLVDPGAVVADPPDLHAFSIEGPEGKCRTQWVVSDGKRWCAEVSDPEGTSVTARLEQQDLPTGPVFVLSVDGIDTLDAADVFPRNYLSASHAQREAEAFLAWRLLKQPAEVPGPIHLPARTVAPFVPPSLVVERRRRMGGI